MSGDSFNADTAAIATASSAFNAEVQPISNEVRKLDTIKGSATTTGRDYHEQGRAYHDAIAGTNSGLAMIISQFSHRCEETSIKLGHNGRDYENADSSNASNLNSSGSGT